MSWFPLEGNFRDRSVGIRPVINGLDNKSHPSCPDCANVDLLSLHPIRKGKFTRAAVRKISSHGSHPIVLGPDLRAFEIARLDQNSMQRDLSIEIETNPLAYTGPVHYF